LATFVYAGKIRLARFRKGVYIITEHRNKVCQLGAPGAYARFLVIYEIPEYPYPAYTIPGIALRYYARRQHAVLKMTNTYPAFYRCVRQTFYGRV